MYNPVGYNVDLGCHGKPVICVDCAIYHNEPCLGIDQETAVELNLVCSDCGKMLVSSVDYWDDDLPDECPNCSADQFFLEIMEDGSVECSRCYWNDYNGKDCKN